MTCEALGALSWLGLAWLGIILVAGAGMLLLIARTGRRAPGAMRTADGHQIERQTQAAQRRASSTRLARLEAAHASPPPAPQHADEPARHPLTRHDRAAIARRARNIAAADFHHEHRRSGNPYPRHSPAFALYAVEYAAAWTALCTPHVGDQPPATAGHDQAQP